MNRSTPGRGWIMLRADALTPEAVVDGLKRGDFYAYDDATRIHAWRRVVAESERVADELREAMATGKLAERVEPIR